MKVLEIKNNLVKIAYEAGDNLALAGFLIIEDSNSPYVAQIMNLKADPSGNFAIVKLLFTFNEEGILKSYNGTIPSLKSVVSTLPAKELLDVIPADNPIVLGKIAQQNTALKIDKTILENNLLICTGSFDNTAMLLDNITAQIDEKVVVIDTDGNFDNEDKIVFGRDFKLPLDYDTINFIYENDLEDVDATSKAVIQDIFYEVQQYTKTLAEGFLPFETFLNVVDSQYRETKIPQLILLKNKLLKYKDLNVFAQNLKDVLNLSIEIEKKSPAIIDISNVPVNLQKEITSYIYKVMNGINETIYAFVKVDNENSDKKLLKTFITNTNVFTTVICQHEYKYITELKEISQNLILFAPLTLQHDFAGYNTYLNKLSNDEFIVYGAHTQNIPLITELADLSEVPEDVETTEETVEEVPQEQEEIHDAVESFEEPQDVFDEVTEEQTHEDFAPYSDIELEPQEVIEDAAVEPLFDEAELIDDTPLIEEEIVDDEPVIENILADDEPSQDNLVEQVAKDVDKVFYEKLEPEEDDFAQEEVPQSYDELSEDDLDLIDDLADEEMNLTAEELPEFDEIEEMPPVVPIYPADDIEESDIQTFEPGDRVTTAKYGEGVVEKMIKYGNKMLCSIDFPNIGRRLLDPAMTEITKLS